MGVPTRRAWRIAALLPVVLIVGIAAGCANVTPSGVVEVPGSATLDYPIPASTPTVDGSPVYPFWQAPWIEVCMQSPSKLQISMNNNPHGTPSLTWNGAAVTLAQGSGPTLDTWTTAAPLAAGCGEFHYQADGDELKYGPSFLVTFAAVA